MECRLFYTKIGEGIYQISDALHGPNEDGYSRAPGVPTQNSYLVVGKERAALIDLAVDTPELLSFAGELAGVPVMVLLTHGHPDHVYHLDGASEAWLHPADHELVCSGMAGIGTAYTEIVIHPLCDGQEMELGARKLEVIWLPGHTMGSVLFYDSLTGTLFTGDTCARRLLYGLTPTVPLDEHCRYLENLEKREFSAIYTAHDRCALPKEYLQTILYGIREKLPKSTENVALPVIGVLRNLHLGEEDTLNYFDMAVTEAYLLKDKRTLVHHLRTLHRDNPMGIDTLPYFSWMLNSEEKNVIQQAYRILVWTEDVLFWDSGYVASPKQSFVVYEGRKLESCTRYAWSVTVWDCYGNIAEEESWFETAFLSKENWRALWIESEFSRTETFCPPFWPLKPPVWFEKDFLVDGKVKKARLYATAHGVYHAYMNDDRADDREFAPEHTVYDKIQYYQTYSVENLLKQGENRLSFHVGDGWYFCPQTRQEISGDTGRPAVLFQLEIFYENGRKQLVCSDCSERCYTGQVIYSDLFLGEKKDATRKGKETHPVVMGTFSLEQLRAQPMEPVRAVAMLPAEVVYRSKKKEWIVDFGQIMCGRARIWVDAPCGTEVTFEYFEVTDREGNYRNTMIAPQKDVYISNGEPVYYEASFTYHGFRYIRISGLEHVEKENFTAVVLSTEKESLGAFECSDSRLNRLYQNIRWSQTNNTLSIPTDCPSREKGGFTGDIQIYARTALLNEQMTPFLTSWLINLEAAQAKNGAVPITVPETAPYKQLMIANAREFGDEWPVGVAGWSDAVVIVPYMMYMVTGNTLILRQQYESMKRWCDYIIDTAAKRQGSAQSPLALDRYLWNTGFHFGEWLIPNGKKHMSHREACEGSAFYTAPIFGYVSLFYMALIAGVLAKESGGVNAYQADAAYYEETARHMKNAIQKVLIKNRQMPTENMGAYVLMIAFDLVPSDCMEEFGKILVALLEKNKGCLNTGFLATPYLLDAFVKIGRKDLAFSLLWQNKCPSWLYEVEQGATAIWESWDAVIPEKEPEITSYDHYAFGCVDTWIFENIAGIRALEPGFRQIEIYPDPDGTPLQFCKRCYWCEYGMISVFWNKEKLQVSIPCGVNALVHWKEQVYSVGSGTYEF